MPMRTAPLPMPMPRPWRGLWLTIASGGALLWRTAMLVVAVGRRARSDAGPARWLLVPGLRLRDGEMRARFLQRVEHAWALWQQHPRCGLVLSGAAARADARSEADAALEHLLDLGLPDAAEVRLDRHARSTLENLRHTCALVDAEQDVVVVSNRYHLARIGWLARHSGLRWRLCGAEPHWRWRPLVLLAVLREAAALVAMSGSAAAAMDIDVLLQDHGHAAPDPSHRTPEYP